MSPNTKWFFGIRDGIAICYGRDPFDWGISVDESELPTGWEEMFNESRLGYVNGAFEEFPDYIIGYADGEYIYQEVEVEA